MPSDLCSDEPRYGFGCLAALIDEGGKICVRVRHRWLRSVEEGRERRGGLTSSITSHPAVVASSSWRRLRVENGPVAVDVGRCERKAEGHPTAGPILISDVGDLPRRVGEESGDAFDDDGSMGGVRFGACRVGSDVESGELGCYEPPRDQ